MRNLPRMMLVLLAFSVVSPAIAGGIPDRIESKWGPERPLWISAKSLPTESARDTLDALPNRVRGFLETALRDQAQSGGDCAYFGEVQYDYPFRLPGTLRAAKNQAHGVMEGTVVASEPGFYHDGPGVLLEVEISERVKVGKFWNGPTALVYWPRAQFSVGSIRVCKEDSRWPEPPALGDSLLLLPIRVPQDEGGLFFSPLPDGVEVILQRKDGALEIPKGLQHDPELSSKKSLAETTALLRTEGSNQ